MALRKTAKVGIEKLTGKTYWNFDKVICLEFPQISTKKVKKERIKYPGMRRIGYKNG